MALLEKNLFIKKSQLPNAGKGLYTKKEIAKGVRIAEYKGKLRKWKDVKHLDGHNGFLMYITRNAVIDGSDTVKALARFANDARGFGRVEGCKNNCEFVSEGNKCFIESISPVKKGEELLVGYGKEFWQLQRKIKKALLK